MKLYVPPTVETTYHLHEMGGSVKVHVVSTRTRNTGGFEWRYKEEDARSHHQDELANSATATNPQDPYITRYIGAVDVPDGLDSDAITAWLDSEGVELWDFDLPHECLP